MRLLARAEEKKRRGLRARCPPCIWCLLPPAARYERDGRKIKVLSAENPQLSKVLSLKPGVGKNIALYASSSAKTFCLPEALNFGFFSTNSLQTETGVLVTVNDTELVKVLSEKPRVGQNIALYASPTARKSTFCFPGLFSFTFVQKGFRAESGVCQNREPDFYL